MAKNTVGLPENFALNVDKPVDLGDYLDDDRPTLAKRNKPSEQETPKQASPQTKENPQVEKVTDIATKRSATEETSSENIATAPKQTTEPKPRKPIRRKQINMTPKTQERFEEFLTFVQEYSPQPDASASEILDAMVSMLHESQEKIKLGAVPPRGRWGSPTAKAFKDALSKAFVEGVAKHYRDLEG